MEAAAKKPKVGNDLTQGSIYKTLIVFAVPIILTNLIQQLYSMVDLMVIAYDSQLLGIQHLRASADMARSIVPDIREVRLPEAIMELLDRVYGFVDAHRDRELLRIGKDGIIDDQERPIFDTIVAELGDLVEAAMAVRYAKQGHLEEGVE